MLQKEINWVIKNLNGNIQNNISHENNRMDDHAYVLAMGAYSLALKRRTDLISKPKYQNTEVQFKFRKPQIRKI